MFLNRYFTYYEKEIPEPMKATNSCLLVGWNLRQACFNLEKTCVMMRECKAFDETCKTCQVKLSYFSFGEDFNFIVLPFNI